MSYRDVQVGTKRGYEDDMVQFGRPVDVGQAKTVRPGRTTFAHAVAGSALLSSSAWLAVLVGVHTGSPAAG